MALTGPHGGRVALTGVCRLERVKLLVFVCPLIVEREICVCVVLVLGVKCVVLVIWLRYLLRWLCCDELCVTVNVFMSVCGFYGMVNNWL